MFGEVKGKEAEKGGKENWRQLGATLTAEMRLGGGSPIFNYLAYNYLPPGNNRNMVRVDAVRKLDELRRDGDFVYEGDLGLLNKLRQAMVEVKLPEDNNGGWAIKRMRLVDAVRAQA
ncbi:MAG: hypothetical protein G01um101416_1063, partial [Microgenomates group bacterium Gr01-1014_16]